MNFPSIDTEKLLKQFEYNSNDPLLFNSAFFLFFMLGFLLVYQFLYKWKVLRITLFTLFSLYFFYKACGYYFLLIVLSAVVDYNLSNWIYQARNKSSKTGLLVFSIVINLGLLCFFKYTNFFIDTINNFQAGKIQPLDLVLPIGISFYTFENLSYTIDVYRGHFKPVNSFLDYCFFLSFFPKLVMGPIVRASDFIPQIRRDVFVSSEDVARGLYLILGGLFKKVVISDYIYVNYVQYIFDVPEKYSGIECLFGVYGYALVIYCDFSGYSDMAIGMAKWMGFSIPQNFDSPYRSYNITAFWRRWHISLSSWLRDYLYIPLGGNQKGKGRQYVNLMLTMLLGGLWHGASWNFVFWGGLHGIALAVHKLYSEKIKIADTIITRFFGLIITFHFVCFCWIFFKAETFQDSATIIHQILYNFNGQAFVSLMQAYATVFTVMGMGFCIHFFPSDWEKGISALISKTGIPGRIMLLVFFIWMIVQVKTAKQVMPVYLQF